MGKSSEKIPTGKWSSDDSLVSQDRCRSRAISWTAPGDDVTSLLNITASGFVGTDDDKPRLHAYDRRECENGRVSNVRGEAGVPLVNLAQVNGELIVAPSPALVDQIETSFVWKPADL